jgi:asparagine synthase (glutamine-hydrolysing)
MCGICGIFHLHEPRAVDPAILERMNEALRHRGPDDGGVHVAGRIGLGHRRLSIVDLEHGKQPMGNEDDSVWVSYNGEIYNHEDLRAELTQAGHIFKTHCDTEVIVHAFEEWGEDCVLRFNGMFAFAVWDERRETLFLARDRLGIKPLYYTQADGDVLFASEIKSLIEHPAVRVELEPSSIPEYLFATSLLGDKTMFKGIKTLPAGHCAIFRQGGCRLRQYWDLQLSDGMGIDAPAVRERLAELLEDAVKLRLMSEVPLGSLLSGGLDSSAISALATKHVDQQLRTFSIEFTGNLGLKQSNSDIEYAALMAETFSTQHRNFILDPEEYYAHHERVTWHLEKPVELTTPSLFLLHKNLKPHVTVVLSGEGADELLGGYYFFLQEVTNKRLQGFPWAPYYEEVSRLFNEDFARETRFAERIESSLNDLLNRHTTGDWLNRVLYLFIKVYLLEMLERQDKTSMAWAVECRVPFLDHRFVEYVANLPSSLKVKDGTEKHILKESFRGLLPDRIIDRKKKPFPFPVDPKSIVRMRRRANDLLRSGDSRIARYFDAGKCDDFFNKQNEFKGLDSLAVFRTSYALISLDMWHRAFGIS